MADCGVSAKHRERLSYTAIVSTKMIAEPDVALSDYALAVETFLFGFWLYRSNALNSLRAWFVILFWSISIAALVGGTVHGFFTAPQAASTKVSWLLTLIFLGLTTLSEYGIAAHLLLARRLSNILICCAVLIFLVYAAVVLFWNPTFRIAVINYVGGLILLLIGFFRLYLRDRSRAALIGTAGLWMTIAASVVQQMHITISPRYFNHNALYHLLEGIALFLIYRAGQSIVRTPIPVENT